MPMSARLTLSPQGHLRLVLHGPDSDAAYALDAPLDASLEGPLDKAFSAGTGHGLLHLGATGVGQVLPAAFAWWRDFAARYVTGLCALPDDTSVTDITVAVPERAALETWLLDLPPMRGAEYADADVLAQLWAQTEAALRAELAASRMGVAEFLHSCNAAWHQVGRVHFNLAENRKDPDSPFAFLATYTSRLSAHGKAQHMPLSRALTEFSNGKQQAQLLNLLVPVQRAAEHCAWLMEMVTEGEIYHPLRWTQEHAYAFLQDVPKLEAAGIVVRTPSNWAAGRPARPKVSASIGNQQPSVLGMDALLDFDMGITLGDDKLTEAEIQALLQGGDGLQLLRGNWVEVNAQKLKRMLQRFTDIQNISTSQGLSFAEAMRLTARASLDAGDGTDDAAADWSEVNAGPWLAQTLQGLRRPEGLAHIDPRPELQATLRPYQEAGVRWLYLLTRLGLGACLADDMGLGKTMQILSLLVVLQRESKQESQHKNTAPCLLVAPASLLANWHAESQRFAPSLKVLIAHPSAMPADPLRALEAAAFAQVDLVITSYSTLLRLPALLQMRWRLVVADEAQALKNPSAKQTQTIKKLNAASRIALTGTPVENRLSDLWSIFDFTHPGLLGSAKVFSNFAKRLDSQKHYGPLRALVSPYILRRLKTDKRVISDLPDKTQTNAWCHLRPAQAALYQAAVKELAQALETADGMARRGLVLSYLMRFKQICNHPSQWQGNGAWDEENSGKFARLRELAEVIAAKQEKMLVFTQFRETTAPLAAFLGSIFGREGLVLHGGTPVAQRRELVKRFQEDDATPFFILSLKAGGSGLNLTAASHVVHFDRWWNPAVENQATDRAYRIGQKRNVLVHKFVCRGTIEERINQMIESKQALVNDVLQNETEMQLTELSDKELLNLVQLDIHTAIEG
ncbi:ATP-dependent helicase [Limnohabitans sp. 2KL-1]|nr:DEAD/DEAH box helicase [Limnohabitans sp. 2KL-1]PUE49351.1 ATP-dependent helicase [Limnohabitans sp. 2KL-1]